MTNPHPFPVPNIGVWLDPAHPQAAMPVRNHEFDYGWDLTCSVDTFVPHDDRVLIPSGVSFEFPPGWGVWLTDRSSTFLKRGLHVHLGKIDCRWREIIAVAAQCMSGAESHIRYADDQSIVTREEWVERGKRISKGQRHTGPSHENMRDVTAGQLVKAGERVGQLVFMPVFEVELTQLAQRPKSIRGGWGSSGT